MSAVPPLRRLIYSSRAVGRDQSDAKHDILAVSRRNNGMDGISGILWSMGDHYLQVLEGPAESVDITFDRIRSDARHADIQILDDRNVDTRQFGDWAMAGMPGDHPEDARERLRMMLRNADAEVVRFFGV